MPITIKDIAEYASVSPATVSLALNGTGTIANKTRQRIQKLASDLGYQPSGIGRALQSGRSGLIGYIIPNVTISYFSDIMQGVGAEATAKGYGLLTAITEDSELEILRQIKIFREKRIDGLLVSCQTPILIPHLLELEKNSCPIVFCSVSPVLKQIPYSITDDFAGGVMAAQHLLQQSAKRLAYYNAEGIRDQRYEGAASIADPLFLPSSTALCQSLRAPKNMRPDGIIAYSDLQAVQVLDSAKDAEVRIPEDLLLIGFDNMPFTQFSSLSLSSIAPQKLQIGRAAVELLLGRIAGKHEAPALFKPTLVARRSTQRK